MRSLAQRKHRTLSNTRLFNNWDILGQIWSLVYLQEVGEKSETETKPSIQWIFCILTLHNDNFGDGGNAKYASFLCLFSEFLSSLLPLAPN